MAASLSTVEDYRALPETGPRFELIEGHLHKLPSMHRYAHDIRNEIFFGIAQYTRRCKIGVVYAAPLSVYLDEFNAFQPDILFVARGNDILTDEGVEGAPDFVVQILLPETAQFEKAKRTVYARCGVKEYWLINPESKAIHAFVLQRDIKAPSAVYCPNEIVTSRHFPGLKFKTAEIFKQE